MLVIKKIILRGKTITFKCCILFCKGSSHDARKSSAKYSYWFAIVLACDI